MINTEPKLALFGASPGTGNLGVDALCWSALEGLTERGAGEVTVFGHGSGNDIRRVPEQNSATHFRLIGTQTGKRVWQRNHIARVALESRIHIPGNSIIDAVRDSALVLDISGGDSFTDLYGHARFQAITQPKRLALRLNRPLVLLPQTYGPFRNERKRQMAKALVSGATLAFARDPDSFTNLQALLGDEFDHTRHREGVDLAFGLGAQATKFSLDLTHDPLQPLIGINVSGLLANRPDASRARFGLSCDYMSVVEQLSLRLLASSNARILLVPHVYGPTGHYEADQDACAALLERLQVLRSDALARVSVLPGRPTAGEIKGIISQMDWFCGTRMHATIAALSSGVPAAVLAYSHKTKGIFSRANQGDAVIDLRSTSERDAVDRLLLLWHERSKHAQTLASALPGIRAAGSAQLDTIASLAIEQQRQAA